MIISEFTNQMRMPKPLKTAVLQELCKATELDLFNLYSTDVDSGVIEQSFVKVTNRMYNKNKRDISRLYNTHTTKKEIDKLSHQNDVAYQNGLRKLQRVLVL